MLDPGKMVYAFAMGSKELYEFIDGNPACATYPVWHVNVPHVIAQNPKMVAINGAIEIDLFRRLILNQLDPGRYPEPVDRLISCWVPICLQAGRGLYA